jgi:hypothetical protein
MAGNYEAFLLGRRFEVSYFSFNNFEPTGYQ